MRQALVLSPGGRLFDADGADGTPRRGRRERKRRRPPPHEEDGNETIIEYETGSSGDESRSPSPRRWWWCARCAGRAPQRPAAGAAAAECPRPGLAAPWRCGAMRPRVVWWETARDLTIAGLLMWWTAESYAYKHSLWWYAVPGPAPGSSPLQ